MNIPPQVAYAFGALLIVCGVLRGYFLGLKKRPGATQAPAQTAAQTATDDGEDAAPVVRRDDSYKRHIRFGIIWVALGLFLVISTLSVTLRQR
jgi:hypothetical protein